jgi:flagellar biosynthetic protein FliP
MIMLKRCLAIVSLMLVILLGLSLPAAAEPLPFPRLELGLIPADGPQEVVLSLQLLFLLTVLSLAPALLILTTSFTRIAIVLSFVRSGLSTQQVPPNQIILGLALFLTFFIMAPYWGQVNQLALQPYLAGELSSQEAFEIGAEPIRSFMFKETRERDLALFIQLADLPRPEDQVDVPTHVLIPAFVISELKTAFEIGFLMYIPFLVIDMVVASTLMSMGMLMLPPVMISLPFKLLLFVMVDGWHLVVQALLQSF